MRIEKVKLSSVGDKETILKFVEQNFQENWVYEVEHSLVQNLLKR